MVDISSELWEKRAGNYGKIEQIETRNLHQCHLPAWCSEKIIILSSERKSGRRVDLYWESVNCLKYPDLIL